MMRRTVIIWRDPRGQEVARDATIRGPLWVAAIIAKQGLRDPALRPSIMEG